MTKNGNAAAHEILGEAMRVFYENPVVPPVISTPDCRGPGAPADRHAHARSGGNEPNLDHVRQAVPGFRALSDFHRPTRPTPGGAATDAQPGPPSRCSQVRAPLNPPTWHRNVTGRWPAWRGAHLHRGGPARLAGNRRGRRPTVLRGRPSPATPSPQPCPAETDPRFLRGPSGCRRPVSPHLPVRGDSVTREVDVYRDNVAHIRDELRRLDLLIRLHLACGSRNAPRHRLLGQS